MSETNTEYTRYNYIFSNDVTKVKKAATIFSKIYQNREDLQDKVLPGEENTARTLARLFVK